MRPRLARGAASSPRPAGTPSPRLTSRGDRHLPQEVAVEGEVEGEDDPLGRKKGGENSSQAVGNLGVRAPGWVRAHRCWLCPASERAPGAGARRDGIGMGTGTQHPRLVPCPLLSPSAPQGWLWGSPNTSHILLSTRRSGGAAAAPRGATCPPPLEGKSLQGEGTPGTARAAPGPVGLTEACRCVLERIPWIFTWLLLAAAMSTQSPRRRASPGP